VPKSSQLDPPPSSAAAPATPAPGFPRGEVAPSWEKIEAVSLSASGCLTALLLSAPAPTLVVAAAVAVTAAGVARLGGCRCSNLR